MLKENAIMAWKDILSIMAGVIFTIAFIPYILAVLRKKTKPSKITWVIWAVLDSITFVGMLIEHSLNGQIVGAVIGVWAVVIVSPRDRTFRWSKLDKFCVGGAILGVSLAQVFQDPKLGILCSCSVVFIASFPTFVQAYRNPVGENRMAWTLYWISCVFAVIAIPEWNFVNTMQPLTFLSLESVMMWILWMPRQSVEANTSTAEDPYRPCSS